MMTPAQLKNYEFKTAGRNAYKAEDVDSFLAEVVINYEKMFRENSELIKRVSLLATKLEDYQNDEVDIKQVVISAQKAADLIVREAEASVADIKSEAEAILAAAKGEADIIKSDAEKQAIADSELVLALATDKAEDILAKAKEKAHGILIEANNSASNTVGQATRTITSESLHYDMLKKEVSEFRASILAQYKAHIELISKLPELAAEEAQKLDKTEEEVEQNPEQEILDETIIENDADAANEDYDYEDTVEQNEIEEDESVIELDSPEEDNEDDYSFSFESDSVENDTVTYIPKFNEDFSDEDEPVSELDAFENFVGMEFENTSETEKAELTASNNFSVDLSDIDLSLFEDDSNDTVTEIPKHIVVDDEDASDDDVSDFFDSIESIDSFDDDEDDRKPRGFFRRKK